MERATRLFSLGREHIAMPTMVKLRHVATLPNLLLDGIKLAALPPIGVLMA